MMQLNHRPNFFLIDKPEGYTSQDVCSVIKQKYGYLKVGHSGTLDPLATGLLVIATDSYTKLLTYVINLDKTYNFTVKFGYTSESHDLGTELVKVKSNFEINKDQLNKIVSEFIGDRKQVPPLYSAIKVKGKRLYEYAKSNHEVEIPTREITINNLEIEEFKSNNTVNFNVTCSKGTYIRSLGRDIGNMLGVGGVIVQLRRTKIQDLSVNKAIGIKQLPNYENFELYSCEYKKLINMRNIDIDIANINIIKNGGFLESSKFPDKEESYLVTNNNKVVAIYERFDDNYYKPRNVLI